MAISHQTGRQGERIAAAHLEKQGFRILEKNWQSSHQEVDIIARKDNLLLIVEVKTRSSVYFGEPEVSVTRTKQRMLIKAANHYILKNNLDVEVRFDIISIIIKNDQHSLNHIEDAFYPY